MYAFNAKQFWHRNVGDDCTPVAAKGDADVCTKPHWCIHIYIYICIGKYAIEEENATNEDWGEIDSENGLCMILRSLLFVWV